MNDVAIIGVGLHPFGRFEGKSAMEMGADAIQAAVADAGVEWKDVQFATGGSWTVANPDAIVAMVGLTGIPFTERVQRLRDRGQRAQGLCRRHPAGRLRHRHRHRHGQAPARRLHRRSCAGRACRGGTRENGQYLTTKFFGMKANRYLHDHGISQQTLAKVAAKNFRNGALNPNAFRRKPISEENILDSPVLNYPLTQYMFCAPDEGAAAVVMCRADIAHRYTVEARSICGPWKSAPAATVPTRSTPRSRRSKRTLRRRCTPSRAAFEKAGVGTAKTST